MASIRDVAQKAGVSPTTVSRTFRTPDLLNEQTQHRVLDAARQLGYQPRSSSPASATRAPGKTQPNRQRHAVSPASTSIGFLFFANGPQEFVTSHVFYAPVLAGAQAEASAHGMNLLIHTTDLTDPEAPLPRMVVEQSVGGLLLVGAVDRPIVDRFAQHRQQVVLVDNIDIHEMGAYESVVSDGFGGELAAIRYLLAQGHRRIAFVTTRRGVPTFQDRLRGYWCGLLEAGITPDPSLVIMPEPQDEGDHRLAAYVRLRKRMSEPAPPTALAAANDSCATFLQWQLLKDGIRVPDDISLVGFDDMPFAADADPPLTTVRVDREAMGRLGVRRLVAMLKPDAVEKQAVLPLLQYKLPVSFVERASCRPRL